MSDCSVSRWVFSTTLAIVACRGQAPTTVPIGGDPVSAEPASASSVVEGPYALPTDERLFTAADVFGLEWAADPQISPDGKWVVYARGSMDALEDRVRSQLWLRSTEGHTHEPLTSLEDGDASTPRWSPKPTTAPPSQNPSSTTKRSN